MHCYNKKTFIKPGLGFGLAVLMATASPTAALVKDNPYNSIVVRNAFGLQPIIKQPIQKPAEAKPPAAGILLTGLTDIGGKEQVLLEVTEAGKPVRRLILSNGEVMDGIEVLRIEVAAGHVRLRVRGEETLLTLQKREPATSGAAVPSVRVDTSKL